MTDRTAADESPTGAPSAPLILTAILAGSVGVALSLAGVAANASATAGSPGTVWLVLGLLFGVVGTVAGAVGAYRIASSIDRLSGAAPARESEALPKFRVDPAKRLRFADDED